MSPLCLKKPFPIKPHECDNIISQITLSHTYYYLTDIHRYPLISTDIHSYPQISTDIHRYPRSHCMNFIINLSQPTWLGPASQQVRNCWEKKTFLSFIFCALLHFIWICHVCYIRNVVLMCHNEQWKSTKPTNHITKLMIIHKNEWNILSAQVLQTKLSTANNVTSKLIIFDIFSF